MIFTSLHYIFFLPLVVGLFWGIPKRYRIWVIAIASAAFYASWNPAYLPLLLLVTGMSWGFGVLLHKQKKTGNISFFLMLFALLLPLFFFKYSNWFIENLNIVVPLMLIFPLLAGLEALAMGRTTGSSVAAFMSFSCCRLRHTA